MVLNLLFISSNLMFDVGRRAGEGVHHVAIFIAGHEFAVMFSRRDDFDLQMPIVFFMKIDRHFDHRQSVEKMEKLFRLLFQLILEGFVEVPMTGGYNDLHGFPHSLGNGAAWLADRPWSFTPDTHLNAPGT